MLLVQTYNKTDPARAQIMRFWALYYNIYELIEESLIEESNNKQALSRLNGEAKQASKYFLNYITNLKK